MKLVRSAYLFRELRELIDGLNDSKDHMIDGADFSMFADQFGVDSLVAANVATLLGYMEEILNTNIDIAGQARFDQLNEYTARLAGQ